MTTESPATVEADLGWALGAVFRSYLRVAEQAVQNLPGGPRGYQVLSAAAGGEARNQLALAHRLGVDRTVMTYLLDDLQGAGLIERTPDPADRRARRIDLTEQGRERFCDLERTLRAAEDDVLHPLGPQERDALKEMLRRIATHAGAAGDEACRAAQEVTTSDSAPAC
ncbi:MarR family winged helix-turn-helix transcriptional regulator [Umezawaea beigongshangensis]|uniref:MarR family winged helix-turn-helix transcriptional regulator n=1 Tax=Umezawaea beigongshangensis TaxID=2780383 RepID=UPI0027DB53F7|nr:MarR family winged helix-turn-helix transcriptional regulator [Umezawaea beigongshangensis]